MGIFIKNTNAKQIHITNSDIVIESIYVRVGWEALPTGKHVKINSIHCYQSKEMFKRDNKLVIPCDIQIANNSQFGLILEVNKQDWDTVAEALIQELSSYGYKCEISTIKDGTN